MSNQQNIPIACDFTAIPPEVREQHMSEGVRIFEKAQEVRELPDGHAFRFANEPGMVLALANFVEYERLCCPFYTFGIEVEAGGGPLWLKLTGGEGVKEFEQAIFGDLSEALQQKLINTGADNQLEETVVQSAALLAQVWDKAKQGS